MEAKIGDSRIDLSNPVDCSVPLVPGGGARAFGAPLFAAEPVRAGRFVGSIREGGPVNFFNLKVNPHGNGTHTECLGHIAGGSWTIHGCLKRFAWWAELVTVEPRRIDGRRIVLLQDLRDSLKREAEALVLRTLPNDPGKATRDWTGTDPPFLEPAACAWMADRGILHLLLDLPSVDPEEDGGALAAHRAFWRYPESPRTEATITEMIDVPGEVPDGRYLLHFQIASMQTDASPSKPVLYAVR